MKNWTYTHLIPSTDLNKSLKTFERTLNDRLSHTFGNIAINALDIFGSGYTANRLVQSNASDKLTSVTNISNYIYGTTYKVEVTSYTSAGTAQISLPNLVKINTAYIGNTTSYTEFEADGTMEAIGDARTFRDEIGDALSLKFKGIFITEDTTECVLRFSTAATLSDYAYKNVQLNHDRDLTETKVYPHLHIFQQSSNVPNALLQYRYQVNGLGKTLPWSNLKINNIAFAYVAGTTIHQILYDSGITVPSSVAQVSDIIQFRIIRDSTNASGLFTGNDPSTVDLQLMSFDVHIVTNTLGSRTEYSK